MSWGGGGTDLLPQQVNEGTSQWLLTQGRSRLQNHTHLSPHLCEATFQAVGTCAHHIHLLDHSFFISKMAMEMRTPRGSYEEETGEGMRSVYHVQMLDQLAPYGGLAPKKGEGVRGEILRKSALGTVVWTE